MGAIAHPLVVVIPTVMVVCLGLWLVWRALLPSRATRVLTRILQLEEERPRLRRIRKRGSVWRLAWKMPVGATVADLRGKLNALEEGLDCSAPCWYDLGLLWAELGTHRLPEVVGFGRFCQRRRGGRGDGSAHPPRRVEGGSALGGPGGSAPPAGRRDLPAPASRSLRQLVTWLVMRYGPLGCAWSWST